MAGALGILPAEGLAGNIAQDIVAKLSMVILARQDEETLSHRFSKVVVVLEILHDGDLGGEAVCVVLYGEADCLVDPKANLLLLHILLILGDVIHWS